jgi:hypothetical protein
MAPAQDCTIEEQVEAKKEKLVKCNCLAKGNADFLRDKVFCLCTVCAVDPIMTRTRMMTKGTAYTHRQADVMQGLITRAELNTARGTKTLLPYGDYFRLFRLYAAGQVDENGIACDVHIEPPAETCGAEAQSTSPDQSQCFPHACRQQHEGTC